MRPFIEQKEVALAVLCADKTLALEPQGQTAMPGHLIRACYCLRHLPGKDSSCEANLALRSIIKACDLTLASFSLNMALGS